MNVARLLARKLAENGVRYVFGIPGGPSIPYMEAFREEGIEFILTSNEASAGIMADVTARLTGIPGICHSTFGPGATNITTGVGEALLDRSPVIALTSEMSDEMINRTVQMNINHQKLFEPVTKATFRMSPSNASEVVDTALKICREEYPGPVHIGLPSGIAEKEASENAVTSITGEKKNIVQNDLQNILPLLEWTRRPLLAAGLTAARLETGRYLADFLEKYPMPVVLTPMAKGLLPEDHPCYAGVLFHSLSDYLEDIFDKTDLVIGLGYDQVEFNYESWLPDVPLLHFDVVKTDLPDRQNITAYTGTVKDWFSILSNLNPGALVFEKGLVKGVRDEMESVFEGLTNHFGPAAAMKILQEELPGDTIITADVGSHLHLAGQYWKTRGNRNILMTNGWSGMGFGIPAALAAQLNRPDSTVVCITGDGGFLMMAGELVTAKRNNLPVIIVVFSDGELNLIKVKQSWKDLSPYGTILYQGDLFESERFFGVRVLNATTAETMRLAVIDALSMNEPVIINAVIDPDDYKWLIVKR
jgi:acetolactate synthase-1/2/3 large subunit